MDFKTVYDIQENGVRDWFLPFIGLVPLGAGLRAWIKKENWQEKFPL